MHGCEEPLHALFTCRQPGGRFVPRLCHGRVCRRGALLGISKPFGGVLACFAVNPFARLPRGLKTAFNPGLL